MKVNQIGSLGEAARFSRMAREHGQVLAASHRSGDNEGGHLAHFAVGFGCGLMKCGVLGGERTAKVNELIRLSEELGGDARPVVDGSPDARIRFAYLNTLKRRTSRRRKARDSNIGELG